MYVITKKQKISQVATDFKKQYPVNRKLLDGRMTDDIYKKLTLLKTEDEIIDLLNDTWTRLICDICKNKCNEIVSMEAVAYEEYRNSYICKKCLEKALELLNQMESNNENN